MQAVNGFLAQNMTGLSLKDFKMKRVVSLELTNSRYIIVGKVALDNTDGDPQNASVQLRRQDGESFVPLDETSVRLAGGGDSDRCEVSVLAGVTFDTLIAPVTVDLACATFRGNASQARLAAIELDFLNGKGGG